MRLYHSTTPEAAEKIVADGFRDSTGTYGTSKKWTGVFLSDVPVDENDGARGDTLLFVDLALSEEDFDYFDFGPDAEKPYGEFCIPAKLVNENASIRLATAEEADERGWELRRAKSGLT